MSGARRCCERGAWRAAPSEARLNQMPLPLPPNPPTHAQQLRLRQTIRDAEQYIAKGLKRFEELTGITVESIQLVRWSPGAYCPTIHIGESAESSQQQG